MPSSSGIGGITRVEDATGDSLVVGSKIRCPNCEMLCDPLLDLRRFDRPKKYRLELNVIYQHKRHRGGCGHTFSPGEQRILMAYLAGDLVPRPTQQENGSNGDGK